MEILNYNTELKKYSPDPDAGINHAPLAGNADYRLHITVLKPGNCILMHVHRLGSEHYIVMEGEGTIYIGSEIPHTNLAKVEHSYAVRKGDTFEIQPGQAHQLVNSGSNDLLLIFGCPDSHLSNAADRVNLLEPPSSNPLDCTPFAEVWERLPKHESVAAIWPLAEEHFHSPAEKAFLIFLNDFCKNKLTIIGCTQEMHYRNVGPFASNQWAETVDVPLYGLTRETWDLAVAAYF